MRRNRFTATSALLRRTNRKNRARACERHGIIRGSGLWLGAEKLRESNSVRSNAIEVVGLAAELEVRTPHQRLGKVVKCDGAELRKAFVSVKPRDKFSAREACRIAPVTSRIGVVVDTEGPS